MRPGARNKKNAAGILPAASGGGEEIRTLAPAKPTYRISNPDPSTTWVHLQNRHVSVIRTRAVLCIMPYFFFRCNTGLPILIWQRKMTVNASQGGSLWKF